MKNSSSPNINHSDVAAIGPAQATRKGRCSAEPTPLPPDDGWDDNNYWSADDPGNDLSEPMACSFAITEKLPFDALSLASDAALDTRKLDTRKEEEK